MRNQNKLTIGLIVAASGLMGTGYAVAQQSDGFKLEEIVITGRKREESLRSSGFYHGIG